jgi:hypothetical protein
VLPGVVGEELTLAHTSAAAVTITGLGGYPTGFDFSLRVMLRRENPLRAPDRHVRRVAPPARAA